MFSRFQTSNKFFIYIREKKSQSSYAHVSIISTVHPYTIYMNPYLPVRACIPIKCNTRAFSS